MSYRCLGGRVLAAAVGSAAAQSYPTQPIRFGVPFTPDAVVARRNAD